MFPLRQLEARWRRAQFPSPSWLIASGHTAVQMSIAGSDDGSVHLKARFEPDLKASVYRPLFVPEHAGGAVVGGAVVGGGVVGHLPPTWPH